MIASFPREGGAGFTKTWMCTPQAGQEPCQADPSNDGSAATGMLVAQQTHQTSGAGVVLTMLPSVVENGPQRSRLWGPFVCSMALGPAEPLFGLHGGAGGR